MIKLTFIGLEALKRELRQLPDELHEEGSTIVHQAATDAKAEIAAAYAAHRRSGGLEDGLEIRTRDVKGLPIGVQLRNRAPHSHLFELGTQARHTNLGADRGTMPAANIFVPAVQRHRRAMYLKLASLLKRKGLTVVGETAAA